MLLSMPLLSKAQVKKPYLSSGWEFIFAFADYQKGPLYYDTPMRFSLFFHSESLVNYDVNKYFGLASGLAIRNIGFRTRNEQLNSDIRRRSYTLGVPAMVKIGDMKERKYAFVGLSYELAFHYKYKRYEGGNRVERESTWFSREVNRILPTAFAGFQYKSGYIKFQYYLEDFLNIDYLSNAGVRPYQNTKSRIFLVSIASNIVKKKSENKDKKKKEEKTKAALLGGL